MSFQPTQLPTKELDIVISEAEAKFTYRRDIFFFFSSLTIKQCHLWSKLLSSWEMTRHSHHFWKAGARWKRDSICDLRECQLSQYPPHSFLLSLRFWQWLSWTCLVNSHRLFILTCALSQEACYHRCFKVFLYQEESFYSPQALIFSFHDVLLVCPPNLQNWGFKNQQDLDGLESKEFCLVANSIPHPNMKTLIFSVLDPLLPSMFLLFSLSSLPLAQHFQRVP